MISKDTLIKVKNRTGGSVGYTIPDLNNLHRNFSFEEEKEIPMDELRKLSYVPGGMEILKECLIIKDREALDEILGLNSVEPEYFYSDEEIKTLLLSGSVEQLRDCLDFAPTGVLDLIKKYAVELKIDSQAKRNAIREKLGFNVSSAILLNEAAEEETKEETVKAKVRRATPITTPPNRKTNQSYRIVSQG